MSDSSLSVPDAAARFFDNYLNFQIKASIPDKQRRWYVKRIEEFNNAHNGNKIKAISGTDIAREYLSDPVSIIISP
jgi:hypothetical protein